MKIFNNIAKIKTTQIIILACLLLSIVNSTSKSNLKKLFKYKFSKPVSYYYKMVDIAFYDRANYSISDNSIKVLLRINPKIIKGVLMHTILYCPSDFPEFDFAKNVLNYELVQLMESEVGFSCNCKFYQKLRILPENFLIVPLQPKILGLKLDFFESKSNKEYLIIDNYKNNSEFAIFKSLYYQIFSAGIQIEIYAKGCVYEYNQQDTLNENFDLNIGFFEDKVFKIKDQQIDNIKYFNENNNWLYSVNDTFSKKIINNKMILEKLKNDPETNLYNIRFDNLKVSGHSVAEAIINIFQVLSNLLKKLTV